MLNRKLTVYEFTDEGRVIFVLQDGNDIIKKWDIYFHPMYSIEQCIEDIFSGEDKLISKLNNFLQDNDTDQFIQTLNQYSIQYKKIVIDSVIYSALIEYLENK